MWIRVRPIDDDDDESDLTRCWVAALLVEAKYRL